MNGNYTKKFKSIGKSAIHDAGFQFHLTLEIQFKIKKLIIDMNVLSKCIETHNEWRKNSWYNSKITVDINDSIDGYDMLHPFTYSLAKKIYAERKIAYDLLISISENSLKYAKNSYLEKPKMKYSEPFYEDTERRFVIVDFDNEGF